MGDIRRKSCSNVFLGLALVELGQLGESEQVIPYCGFTLPGG